MDLLLHCYFHLQNTKVRLLFFAQTIHTYGKEQAAQRKEIDYAPCRQMQHLNLNEVNLL